MKEGKKESAAVILYLYPLKQGLKVGFGLILLFLPIILVAAINDKLTQGQTAYDQGNFAQAIQYWETALARAGPQETLLIRLATAYQAIGNYDKAFSGLQRALSLAKTAGHRANQSIILSMLSDLYLATHQLDQAKTTIDEGLAIARKKGKPLVLAHVLNNLGNILAVSQQYPQAITAYEESQRLAEQENDTVLASKAVINRVQAAFYNGLYPEAIANLVPALQQLRQYTNTVISVTPALEQLQKLPEIHDKVFGLITLGRLAQRIQQQLPKANPNLTLMAYQALNEARRLADNLQNAHAASYAYGHLGELYEYERRYDEAMRLTRQAIFWAQKANSQETLYRWYWQLGRLLAAQNERYEAIAAYQKAIQTLQPVRAQLATTYRSTSESFQQSIEPVYLGLADLLLQNASNTRDSQQREQDLRQARNTIELLKMVEIQDYLQDNCVKPQETLELHNPEPHTAVLYPIILADRIELLLNLPTGLSQFTVPVKKADLRKTVLAFRKNLGIRSHFKFLEESQQLYRWLIAPLATVLTTQQIDTLVIVPDSIVRTVPLAALYDGRQFLIEKMAIATTQGLSLTNPQPPSRQASKALLAGLSAGVQGFAPLPNVPEELRNIQTLFASTLLENQQFSLNNLKNALKKTHYTIVHIASHGQFDSDPNKTFLLTYDKKLTIGLLEQLLLKPTELLTLSACQTAVGDERGALGLAGVAIKAGARSTLASLWFIDDTATSTLLTTFYRELQKNPFSKVKALQKAQ
ncbi:MAG: hypothetical protein BWK79_10125, partial [Beggiatoa sp. IS2]